MPEVTCPDYNHLEILDTQISWDQVDKGDIKVWQFSMSAYSKPTDAHAHPPILQTLLQKQLVSD